MEGKWSRAAVTGMGIAALAGCGEARKPATDAGARMEQATKDATQAVRQGDLNQAGKAIGQMGAALAGGSQVEPVDFRRLKALLPETLGGWKRVNAEGSRTNVIGITSSRALASYADGKGGTLEVELVDMGSLTGVTALAFAWVTLEIDKESDDGYERTFALEGRKAFERYSRKEKAGELDVLVASRFVVTLKGRGVDAPAFRAAVAGLDLAGLDALKNLAVEK